MEVRFSNNRFKLVITDHARQRMKARNLTKDIIISVIETGKVKAKVTEDRYWVYADLPNRRDNSICLSVAVERPHLVVVTALVNWRPER